MQTNYQTKLRYGDVDSAISALIHTQKDLNKRWSRYILCTYGDFSKERMAFVDIHEIVEHIVDRYKNHQTLDFRLFFGKVEEILTDCTVTVENLMVYGLLYEIQNHTNFVSYIQRTRFDKWLGPISKRKWDYMLGIES